MAIVSSKNASSRSTAWSLTIATGVTAVLYVVPFLRPLSYPFMLLSTLVHEVSHGLVAMVVGGHFNSFKMWADGSGVANISGHFGRLSQALIAAGGLMGPAIFASLFFLALSKGMARGMLAAFGIALLLLDVFFVRNLFGIVFVLLLSALCLYVSFGPKKAYAQLTLGFFASQLSLAVFSRADYLFTKVALTESGPMPSDVAQIEQALWLPYWFWGGLIGIFSVLVLLFGLKRIFRT